MSAANDAKDAKDAKAVKTATKVAKPDKLCFFSRSKEVAPGFGAGEHAPVKNKYAGLPKDFRKVLSNFHVSPFRYEGKMYNTIEHAFQATKIALQDAKAAETFAMESKSDLSIGGGEAARKNRKMVILSPEALARWEPARVMAEIAKAKYDASAAARGVLTATADAQLWHIIPRGQPVRFTHLEQLRAAYLAQK
jgi:predicted NAD-dependent protein-ADP-ribosyltransferase YbiA (DUF1768 family)